MNMNARILVEQSDAARVIEVEFGVPKAIEYLVGEKFINFLEACDYGGVLAFQKFIGDAPEHFNGDDRLGVV